MPHQSALKQWEADVSRYLDPLPGGLVRVLALYAFGMALARHSGQTLVVELLSQLLKVKANTMRQRLRELTYEKQVKRGPQRRELAVHSCFAPLLRWALSWLTGTPAGSGKAVLAMDVTYLGERFTILAISLVVSGCAIPVAWRIQQGGEKGSWQAIWLDLFGYLKDAVPVGWSVDVLADSGLYSKRLFVYLHNQCGWHPHMRIGTQGLCREANGGWQPLAQLARRGMTPTAYRLICFKGDPLMGTVLVEWSLEQDQPCLVLTDLDRLQARHETYHRRFWIESGFKDLKRGGLRWEQTKMTCPQRAERLWLVLSLALLYLVSLGVPDEVEIPRLRYARSAKRALSCVNQGWVRMMTALILSPATGSQDALRLKFADTYP